MWLDKSMKEVCRLIREQIGLIHLVTKDSVYIVFEDVEWGWIDSVFRETVPMIYCSVGVEVLVLALFVRYFLDFETMSSEPWVLTKLK